MGSQVQVALVARNEIVREGWRHILKGARFSITAMVTDAHQLLSGCVGQGVGQDVDLIIVDTGPLAVTLAACSDLHQALPTIPIVMLADDCNVGTATEAFATGISAYVARGTASEVLVGTLRLAALGEKVVPSELVPVLARVGAPASDRPVPPAFSDGRFTERELAILACLAAGQSNKLISRQLCLTEASVKAHLKAIMRKLGVNNRTQAAVWTLSQGCAAVEPPPMVPPPGPPARPTLNLVTAPPDIAPRTGRLAASAS